MSTIKATLQAQPDGTVHLPLPPGLRHGTLQITATVEPVAPGVLVERGVPGVPGVPVQDVPKAEGLRGFGCLKGMIRLAPDFDDPLEDFKEYTE